MAEITLDKLTKVYGDGTRAVSELDLEIADGEFVVLVGPSGCGKTTALRMLAGLEQLDKGDIRIDGKSVVAAPLTRSPRLSFFMPRSLSPKAMLSNALICG